MSYQNLNAYTAHQQVQMDGREIDKRALLQCAARLKEALDNGGKDMKKYQEAVRHNQHLWTLFQVALVDQSNPLKQELKLTLLRLSGYVDRTSFSIISQFTPEKIESLININRIIAAGLAKKPQQESAMPLQNQAPLLTAQAPAAVRIST